MKITEVAKKISVHEKGKKGNQVGIADISEILVVLNKITRGILYAVIRALPK